MTFETLDLSRETWLINPDERGMEADALDALTLGSCVLAEAVLWRAVAIVFNAIPDGRWLSA